MRIRDFLAERIDDDERVARQVLTENGSDGRSGSGLFAAFSSPTGLAIDAQRVIDECEAKRQLLGQHGRLMNSWNPRIRAAARVYSAHPDFEDRWRS